MSSFTFGKRSLDNLSTCHYDLDVIMNVALKSSMVDFGISEGHRSLERQFKLFTEGKSRIDGKRRKGKHNYYPSLAVDIYAYVPGRKNLAFDKVHLAYLGGHITAIAEMLYQEERVSHRLRWGGNWDGDGILIYDQHLIDMPHFELVSP